MKFDPTVSVGDLLVLVGFLFTIYALWINYKQLKRNEVVERAGFVAGIVEQLFTDVEQRKFFYLLDYEEFEFTENLLDDFKGSDSERLLDTLLMKYDYIGGLVRRDVLQLKDIEFISFEIIQVFKNVQVGNYVRWLDSV